MTFNEPGGSTPLDEDEKLGLKHPHITTRGELNELEQANIEQGLIWLSRTKQRNLLNEKFSKLLHKKLFGDVWQWAGKYRITAKNIGIHAPYIGQNCMALFNDVEYWIKNSTYSNQEIAIRFHHRLVQIHPFPNGNGRHSRIIADGLLQKTLHNEAIDWTDGQSLNVSNERRMQYITALREADHGNYDPLFIFTKII